MGLTLDESWIGTWCISRQYWDGKDLIVEYERWPFGELFYWGA